MFEGKELDKKIGEFGGAFIDLKEDLTLEVGISLKVDLLAEGKKLAEKSGKPWIVSAVSFIEGILKKDAA